MIKKTNLICNNGHRWWAPRPERWIGRACGISRQQGMRPCVEVLKAHDPTTTTHTTHEARR